MTKENDFFVVFAISAYWAYKNGTAYRPPNTPAWEHLTPELQGAWISAVKQVFYDFKVSDAISGEFVDKNSWARGTISDTL